MSWKRGKTRVFKSNSDIAEKLLDTGEEEINEATTKENYWGCGPLKNGQNNYGKLLVKVRKILRQAKRGDLKVASEYISRKGHEKLYEECQNIDKEIFKYQQEMGESAKRDNDLRENPECMELRVKLTYVLPEQKRKVNERYDNAVIIEDTEEYRNFDGVTVIKGSEVEVLFDGEKETYTILGNSEGNLDENILSCDAPIAETLLGRKIGDIVNFNNFKVEILSVKKV